MTTTQIIEKTTKVLNNANIFADIYNAGDDYIEIEVSWGDWKHDHLALDYYMAEAGFVHTATTITEEDGSDTYSAVHTYEI